LKEKRERIERGVGREKREVQGFLQNCHLLPPSLDLEQRGERAERWPAGGGDGGPMHGGGRGTGQNGEEAEGNRFPCSPWVGAECGGGSTGGGGLEVGDCGRRRSGAQAGKGGGRGGAR
jgi:hypothetical protein